MRPTESLAEVLRVLGGFLIVDFTQNLSAQAVQLVRAHGLRGADAVHLASALHLSKRLRLRRFHFATSDDAQADAARAEGLRVLSPGA
ncbi:MAG: hypothetical protein FD180_794 [Planctomycetota bacterium]|nr:MAG: hypothetical protein FD180_794 [Planctomycetota bacterium]